MSISSEEIPKVGVEKVENGYEFLHLEGKAWEGDLWGELSLIRRQFVADTELLALQIPIRVGMHQNPLKYRGAFGVAKHCIDSLYRNLRLNFAIHTRHFLAGAMGQFISAQIERAVTWSVAMVFPWRTALRENFRKTKNKMRVVRNIISGRPLVDGFGGSL